MPRSVLLGRPWPAPGEPLFLPDDTDGALELAADEEARCPRGHFLDEDVPVEAHSLTCEACAVEDSARRAYQRDVDNAGPNGDDLLDGRYFFARTIDLEG